MTNPDPESPSPRFHQVRSLFDRASALPLGQQEAYVRAQVLGDEALAQGVLSLLRRVEVDTTAIAGNARVGLHEEASAALATSATAPSPPEAQVNGTTEFGRYRLLRCLGQGGMGSVYLALDLHLMRHVAIKQILAQHLANPEVRARFRRESLVLSRLDHPNLCRLFDAGEHEGVPFVAMQYVAGQTLSAAIAAAADGVRPLFGAAVTPSESAVIPLYPGRQTIASLLEFFAKAARALHHAHQQGLVHRDVKPGNLMITTDLQPVVLDFGLAADHLAEGPSLTGSGGGLGTPLYMPPEQIEGRHVDARSDVYSLAVSLYHALALRPPFLALTQQQLYVRIAEEAAPDPRFWNRQVDRDLSTVLSVAMAKHPADRYRDAASFAEDLTRILARQPILARRHSVALRVWRWSQRNRAVAVFLVLVTVSLMGTVAALVSASVARAGMRTSLQYFNRLAAFEDLRTAEGIANDLWPAWPERIPDLERWIASHGEPLAAQLATMRRELRELESLPRAAPAARLGDRDEVDPATQAYVLRTMREQLPVLANFVEGENGTRTSIARRLAWARSVEAASLADAGWATAIAAIAEDRRFGGLRLQPQVDLVPLGADRRSGFQEFLHLPSHGLDEPRPLRDSDGNLLLSDRAGIVFVLLPGGTFTMGARRDRDASNCDPDAEPDEGVLQSVALEPFFLAKHELTQAQWLQITGVNRSQFQPETPVWSACLADGSELSFRPFTLRHPVEQVNWLQCEEVMRQQGLVLPTEAQWEYACRAGTNTPHACGGLELRRFANLADQFARLFTDGSFGAYHDWSDGFVVTAPVGSFLPNAFGLHDMHGNVYEWCADWLVDYAASMPRAGDGLREPTTVDERRNKVYRGGDFRFRAVEARSANRMRGPVTEAGNTLGLRPARRLHPR